jgi:Holliday junction resolvasome RuvABC endonuclease subunit
VPKAKAATNRRSTKKKRTAKDLVGRWRVGIDPGFGMTGLILMKGNEVAAFSSFTSPPSDDVIGRVTAMSNSIVTHILKWIWQFELEQLDIGIETPVYNSNAGTLMLQMRLLQDVESGIYHLIAPELKECMLYEVNPVTSKSLSTGNGKADKAAIIVASPLCALWSTEPAPQEIMEAVADAWSHSLIVLDVNAVGNDMVKLDYVPCMQTSDAVLIDAPNEPPLTYEDVIEENL